MLLHKPDTHMGYAGSMLYLCQPLPGFRTADKEVLSVLAMLNATGS